MEQTPKRNRSVLLPIISGLIMAMAVILAAVYFIRPATKTAAPAVKTAPVKTGRKTAVKTAPVQSPAALIQAPRSRINVNISTPAGSRVKVDVIEEEAVVAPAPTPAPAAQHLAAPPIVPPAPLAPPVPVQPPVAPPKELFQAPSAPVPPSQDQQAIAVPAIRTAGAPSSWITFQLNIGASGGWGGYYGPAYGWTPGHEAIVCEPGHGCFRRWVSHPMPGPYWW